MDYDTRCAFKGFMLGTMFGIAAWTGLYFLLRVFV